jgi:MFS family permease
MISESDGRLLLKHFSNLPRARVFWFLMLNIAISGMASTMLSPFLPIFLNKQLGISVGAVSFLYFMSGLMGTLTVFLVGWLVDRVGRKKIYIFGNSEVAVLPAALGFVRTFLQALPVMTIYGVMDSATRTSQTTIIADQVEEKGRNTAFGVSRVVVNCPWIVAPVIGGIILAGRSNYSDLFLTSFLIGIAALIAFIILVPESRKAGLERPKLPKIEVFKNRDLLLLCIASLFTMLFYTQFYSLLPIYAAQVKGLNTVQIGYLFSISGITVVALQLPTSFWLNKLPQQAGYILGVVILAAGISAIALAPNFYWLLLAVAVMTIGENMFFPIAFSLVTQIGPESDRGMYVGALNLFLSLGANVSPLLGGTIWQLTGQPNLPWLLSPVCALISVMLAILFRRTRPKANGALVASKIR